LLSEATSRAAWPDDRLPAGTRWNTEAGDLDGVVSLVLDDDVPDLAAGSTLVTAATAVAKALRQQLPACPLQAVTGSGDGYANAFEEIERARRDGRFLVDSPAPVCELVLAKPCDVCRISPAERAVEAAVQAGEKPPDLCADCTARVGPAGGTKGSWQRRSPRPERRLRKLLEEDLTVTAFPDDFADLAERGRADAGDASTQLGLIYADGNQVGAFLSEAAEHARRHGTPAKSDIVPALDGAVLAALADAVRACYCDPASRSVRPDLLAHLAGGDDLLISVPARSAWPFLLELLPAFGREISDAADWPDPVRKKLPSLSAGLVFHHASAPFADVVRLAGERLRAAKGATAGKAPSVAFLDLTADGGSAPPSRPPLLLTKLAQDAGRLSGIATVSRSQRETLLGLERLARQGTAAQAGPGRGETPAQALARRVVDLGSQPIWDAVTGRAGATGSEVRAALENGTMGRDNLRRELDLARWWPPAGAAAERSGQVSAA
jgi:hypothetical protein